jgi:hypothetical protein
MRRAGVYGLVAGAAPSAVAKSPKTRQMASEWGLGLPVLDGTGEEGPANSLAGLRPQEQDRRRENGGGRAPGGSGNSGEESRPRGGKIGRAKAWTGSGEVKGTLWTKARAQDGFKSTGHHAAAANRCGRTPARPN